MKMFKMLFPLLLAMLFLFACKSEPKQVEKTASEKIADNVNESVQEALKNFDGSTEDLQKSIEDVVAAVEKNVDKDIKIVSFRDLKTLIPEEVAGMKRKDKGEGSTTKIFGIKVSQYGATYTGADNEKLKIQIMDTGGMGTALMAAVPWSQIEVDKETANGYERTTEYKGYKAFEKYDEKRKKGEFMVLVDGRFVVTINGRNVSAEKMEAARAEIGYDDLRSMAKK